MKARKSSGVIEEPAAPSRQTDQDVSGNMQACEGSQGPQAAGPFTPTLNAALSEAFGGQLV